MNSRRNINLKFLEASKKGYIEQIVSLLQSGADINYQKYNGDTALMEASEKGHIEVVRLLLENGANPNLQTMGGITALHRAADRGSVEIIRELLGAGADINALSMVSQNPLMMATGKLNVDAVKELIESGASLNVKNRFGSTALMILLSSSRRDPNKKDKQKKILDMLIEAGADINEKNDEGATALMRAAISGDPDFILTLVKVGANINDETNKGLTALNYACTFMNIQAAKILLELGAVDYNNVSYNSLMQKLKEESKILKTKNDSPYIAYLLLKYNGLSDRDLLSLMKEDRKLQEHFAFEATLSGDLEALEYLVDNLNTNLSELTDRESNTLLIASVYSNNLNLTKYIYNKVYENLNGNLDAFIKYVLRKNKKNKIAIELSYEMCHKGQFRFLYDELGTLGNKVKDYVFVNYLSKIYPCRDLDYVLIEYVSNSFA